MVHQQHHHQGGGSTDSGGSVVAVTALGLAGWSVVTLFSLAAAVAVAVGLYAVVAIFFCLGAESSGRGGWMRFFLIVSILAALAVTPLVFVNHVVPYAVAGWSIFGLFVVAMLVGWSGLELALKWIAVVFTAAMAVALIVLPAPDAAADPADEAARWRVIVTVRDEADAPLAGALVQCFTIMVWERGEPFVAREESFKISDENGQAEFSFLADTRLKLAMCAAAKLPSDDQEGYAFRTGVTANPFRGGTFPVDIQLTERIPVGSRPVGLPDAYTTEETVDPY